MLWISPRVKQDMHYTLILHVNVGKYKKKIREILCIWNNVSNAMQLMLTLQPGVNICYLVSIQHYQCIAIVDRVLNAIWFHIA